MLKNLKASLEKCSGQRELMSTGDGREGVGINQKIVDENVTGKESNSVEKGQGNNLSEDSNSDGKVEKSLQDQLVEKLNKLEDKVESLHTKKTVGAIHEATVAVKVAFPEKEMIQFEQMKWIAVVVGGQPRQNDYPMWKVMVDKLLKNKTGEDLKTKITEIISKRNYVCTTFSGHFQVCGMPRYNRFWFYKE